MCEVNVLQLCKEVEHIPSNATIKTQGIVNYIIENGVNTPVKRGTDGAMQVGFIIFENVDYEYFCVDCEIYRFEKFERKISIYNIVAQLRK